MINNKPGSFTDAIRISSHPEEHLAIFTSCFKKLIERFHERTNKTSTKLTCVSRNNVHNLYKIISRNQGNKKRGIKGGKFQNRYDGPIFHNCTASPLALFSKRNSLVCDFRPLTSIFGICLLFHIFVDFSDLTLHLYI